MSASPSHQEPLANIDSLAFRIATAADIDAIVALVNSAYRGDSSRAGWTTEADILGGQRTDAGEISRLVSEDDSAIMLCMRDGELIGSVHMERVDAANAYMGMLVIKPVLQGQVHQSGDVIGSVGMLGQAHAPDEYGFAVTNQFGNFFQFLTRYTRAVAGRINVDILNRITHGVKADGLVFAEVLIMPAFIDDNFL